MRSPNVKILGANLSPRAICDDAVSLRYTKRFCGAGEFELVLPANAAAVPAPDEYVLCGGELFVAEKIDRNAENGRIAVGGRGALSMLSRRIVPRVYNVLQSVDKTACDLVRAYASSLYGAPLSIETPQSAPARQIVVEAGDLYERVVTLVMSVRKGIALTFDGEGFDFAVTQGRERLINDPFIADPALLSESLGTIRDVREISDRSRYKNKVYVHGLVQNEPAVVLIEVSAEEYSFPDGFDDSSAPLREGYVASGIGAAMFTSTDQYGNSVFDSGGYYAALRERGRRELALHRPELTLEAKLTGGAEDDVDTGDVCTLSSGASDVTSVRVTEKEYRFANGSASCTAKLTAVG